MNKPIHRPEFGRGDHPYAQGFYAAWDSNNNKKLIPDNPYVGEFEGPSHALWNEGRDTFIDCCLPREAEDERC